MATAGAAEEGQEGQWEVKFREDEELEFYTELALHETERWISAVTKKSFAFPEDPRKSLENGILLCELLNTIKPGSVKRINKLPTPIAGLDNLHVFLKACRDQCELNDTQLFDPSDLEDLSQRAIADSEHLKEELDRRLRNVAITVYWIGRVTTQTYQGPKIDQSAFAALVHNQHRHREHIVSDGQLRRDSCSWETNSHHSSTYGSHEGGGGGNLRGSSREPGSTDTACVQGPRHVRDGSYDSYSSYGKGSEDSLEEFVFEVDENGMPIPRYSSQSALNQTREGARRGGAGGGEHDDHHHPPSSMYSLDRNSGMYRSSPDLSHGSLSRRRTSSTDGSTDDSHGGGGHSRQSSDSMEYPTRRRSTATQKKASVSADPLQFVKLKGATDLACTAQEQIKLVKETKKLKITESISEDDGTDWSSNLAIWKNRRKSHSEKSYQLKEELEQMEREKEEPVQATISTKTFSQMQEERERRKSAPSKHFYPIEDEGEDDIFSPGPSEEKHSAAVSRSSSRFQSSMTSKEDTKDTKVKSRTKEGISKWAHVSASEEEEAAGNAKETLTSSSHNNTSSASEPEPRTSHFSRDTNNTSSASVPEPRTYRFSRDTNNTSSASEPEPRTSRFSRDSESSVPRQRRSGLPEYHTQDKRDSWQKNSDTGRDSALKENNRNSSLSARSSGKISNILKNFENKDAEEGAKPQTGVNSSVDVGARKKSFENIVGRSSGDVDSFRSWSTDRDKGSVRSNSRSEMTSHSSSAAYASSRNSGKDYVEKTIKISQKPNSAKGFGFTLSGGADKKQPVVVQKVGLGSAADVCELQAKDEVVSINGQSVGRLTSVELTRKVQDSVKSGQIELRVKRFLGSGGDLEDEEDFLSTDEEVDTPDRSVSKSSSIRAENSFDSLDSRDGPQRVEESVRPCIEEHIPPTPKTLNNRRGDPTSTSSDSGYDAQTFSPYHRGDNSSNEEEVATSQPQQGTESQARSSRALRARHLYPRDEDENDYVNLPSAESSQPSLRHEYSDSGMGKEVAPPGEVEVQSRPTITIRRPRAEAGGSLLKDSAAAEEDNKPVATSEARSELLTGSRRMEEKHSEQTTSEDSDSGPPAALRRWQRQRPRSEYTFESDDQPPSKFYDQMKMSSTSSSTARHSERDEPKPEEAALYKSSDDTDDTVSNVAPVVSSRRAFRAREDRQRMHNWNQKQEEERQPADQFPSGHSEASVENTFPYQQQRFTAEREQIQHRYQQDLQHAADTGRQKQEQDQKLLEPELEKMRVLEQRRAQRQARLQMYAQDLNADFAPPPPPPPPPSSDDSQLSQQPQQQHTSTFVAQISPGGKSPAPAVTGGNESEVLVIDPRNRAGGDSGEVPVELSQTGQPLHFQLKINSRETPQGLMIRPEMVPTQHTAPPTPDHAAFLEAERERIRREELQRIEAERRGREEEEMKVIREKEERLRQQEEYLRRQEEELRKTQERLEQERQQLQQQRMASPKPQQSDYHFSPQGPAAASHHESSLQFETVTSKVRGSSPVYTSTIVAGPRRPQSSHHAYADHGQENYGGARRSEPSWNSDRPQTVSSSQGRLPKWPPGGEEEEGRRGSNSRNPQGDGRYSRQDMMAMNRQATPLQATPHSPAPHGALDHQHHHQDVPVKREAPNKSQIHSLNSAPRAKFRNADGGWMGDEPSLNAAGNGGGGGGDRRSPQPVPRRSDAYLSNHFAGPQDHWLVQEAERRRLNHSGQQAHSPSRAQFSGPIKPVTDNYGNRWREQEGGGGEVRRGPNMPAQIRQTLLQKTAGARGSTASSSSQEAVYQPESAAILSQTLPSSFGYSGGYAQGSRSDAGPPPQQRAPSPVVDGRGDGGVNLSGKQRCSHCDQELGFGAAMVIESLGLYYHTQCFKCCVCRTPLGSGVEGADVRVRVNKLHCPNCYSNDEDTTFMS